MSAGANAPKPRRHGLAAAGTARFRHHGAALVALTEGPPMPLPGPSNAMDHVVVIMFENRSFDNLLGRLYQPGEVVSFEGVTGKELSNPIPEWAEDGAGRKVVPYGVAATMDTPNPDAGEEYQHVNTQLFGVIDPPGNRGVLAEEMAAPYNAPAGPAQRPTMDGFVADYISAFTAEMGRQPSYGEYAQIMTGYTPEQMPVVSALARGLRHLRPLVLRGPVADVHQPVVLPRRQRVRLRGEHLARGLLPGAQHRRDDLRADRGQGPDLAGLLRPVEPHLAHRPHPRVPAVGALRHPLRHHRPVPARTRPAANCRPTRSSSRTSCTATTTCTPRSTPWPRAWCSTRRRP